MYDLYNYLSEHNFPSGKELAGKQHKEFKNRLLAATSFLNGMKKPPVIALRLHCVESGITSLPACEECNGDVSWIKNHHHDGVYKTVFTRFCSTRCANRSSTTKQRKLDTNRVNWGGDSYLSTEEGKRRYAEGIKRKAAENGVDPSNISHSSQLPWYQDKRKATFMKRTGYEHNMKAPEGKQRHIDAVKAAHGVSHVMHVPEIRNKALLNEDGSYRIMSPATQQKIREGLAAWDNGHPMRNDSVKLKMQVNSLDLYGRMYPNQQHFTDEAIRVLQDKDELSKMIDRYQFLDQVADVLGVSYSAVQRATSALDIHLNVKSSYAEQEIHDLVSEMGYEVIRNTRGPLGTHEVDIYVPEAKLCIEYNGVYWHSEIYKDRSYHQNKSLLAYQNGLKLIHVWEDDWKSPCRRKIVENKIKAKLGVGIEKVYARKTEVRVISTQEAKAFYETTHVQGHVNGTAYIALYHGGECVACVTLRHEGDGTYDLSRYATSKRVVGGLGKLLAHFKKTYDWKKIFTFASLDYSMGDLYEQTGFTRKHITPPNLWYVHKDSYMRMNRHLFMKHKLEARLPDYDETLTERENMKRNGFFRIYDSGSIRYEMVK